MNLLRVLDQELAIAQTPLRFNHTGSLRGLQLSDCVRKIERDIEK